MIRTHVPRPYWDDAIVTVVYLINYMPSRVLEFCTSVQVLAQHGPLPSVLMLTTQVFGCMAYVHLHKTQQSKLDPCVIRCVFVPLIRRANGVIIPLPDTHMSLF